MKGLDVYARKITGSCTLAGAALTCIFVMTLCLCVDAKGHRDKKTGEIRGRVMDQHDRLLGNAKVFIEAIRRTVFTNERGEFILSGIPRGHYTLECSLAGYAHFQRLIIVNRKKQQEQVICIRPPDYVPLAVLNYPSAERSPDLVSIDSEFRTELRLLNKLDLASIGYDLGAVYILEELRIPRFTDSLGKRMIWRRVYMAFFRPWEIPRFPDL